MILVVILAISVGVVLAALGVDIGRQVWVDKKSARKIKEAKRAEALALLRTSIARKMETTMELKVVVLPKKPKHAGKHRFNAA